MPSSVQQTFVERENGTDTKNGCKEAKGKLNDARIIFSTVNPVFYS